MRTAFILIAAAALAGCTTRTEYGACVGAFDEKDPALVYKVSGWNLAMAIFGFELIAPPILVVVDSTFCPVARKEPQK